MEAILLVGGLGTRLRSEAADVPKAMAEINGEPFLNYQLRWLKKQGVNQVIMAVGYLKNNIKDYYKDCFEDITIFYSEENEPLGTGGAISKAIKLSKSDELFILNGDTMMMADLNEISKLHQQKSAKLTICLKPMKNFSRFGSVEINENKEIVNFFEKKKCIDGLINAGIYFVNKSWILSKKLPEKYSFEQEILESSINQQILYGSVQDCYFLDIGIPEDFQLAQKEFKHL